MWIEENLHKELKEHNIFAHSMILYALTLGFLVGFVVGFPVSFAVYGDPIGGLFIGLLSSVFVGFVYIPFFFAIFWLNSVIMRWTTLWFFQNIQSNRRYKMTIGIVSSIFTLVFFFVIPNIIMIEYDIPLVSSDDYCTTIAFFKRCGGQSLDQFVLPPEPFYIAWLFSLMFPIYASLRTIDKYLKRIGLDKTKSKIEKMKVEYEPPIKPKH